VLTAHADDFFGSSVGTAGDVNGDGYADLIVGAHGNDAGGANAGRAFVLSAAPLTLAAALDLDPNVVNLAGGGPWITAHIISTEFAPEAVDLSTVRLAGSVPPEQKPVTEGDSDGDGVPELMLKFSREALVPLLAAGENEVALTGSLLTGERFKGTDVLRVIDPPRRSGSASVIPNPLNPAGVLSFRTSRPGPVGARLFDLQGRMVRSLLDRSVLPAGLHEVRIDAGGERAGKIPSGVYFYRVDSPDGILTGRIAVLK
jgi:hypothetical protein